MSDEILVTVLVTILISRLARLLRTFDFQVRTPYSLKHNFRSSILSKQRGDDSTLKFQLKVKSQRRMHSVTCEHRTEGLWRNLVFLLLGSVLNLQKKIRTSQLLNFADPFHLA